MLGKRFRVEGDAERRLVDEHVVDQGFDLVPHPAGLFDVVTEERLERLMSHGRFKETAER